MHGGNKGSSEVSQPVDLKRQQMAVPEQAVILKTLAESVAHPGCRLLEVGSWCGDSAMVLGEVAKRSGGHLYCVDWWKGNVETELERIAAQQDIYSVFWRRMCDGGLADVVIPMRGKSGDITGILSPGAFDLVYIDGDHRYTGISSDISGFAPAVREGGILCGDDCEGRIDDFEPKFLEAGKHRDYTETVHCGVVLAVADAFPKYSIDYNIWSVKRVGRGWKPTELDFPGVPKKRQFHPPLVEVYGRYNFCRYGRRVYAIPHGMTGVDITLEGSRKLLDPLSAETITELKARIDNDGRPVPRDDSVRLEESGVIRKAGFLGFDIVQSGDTYYAIHRARSEPRRNDAGGSQSSHIIPAGSLGRLLWSISRYRVGRLLRWLRIKR